MIKLWGRANSINVQKVTWLISELGLEMERVDCGGPFGGLDSPDITSRSVISQIPCLSDGDVNMSESNAICRYLAARYGAGSWWPETLSQQALADQWMDWFQNHFYLDHITVFLQLVRVPEPKRDMALLAKAKKQTAHNLTMFDKRLGDLNYLTGDQPTVADIPIGTALYRYYELDYERPDLPRLAAYYNRLKARPAYARAVMLPLK